MTSAALHDGFYALCEDVTRYYAAAVVTETCDRISLEGMQAAPLLVAAVTALEGLCADEPLALLTFLLAALAYAGYPVETGACPACGRVPAGRMRFSFADGAFFCDECLPDAVPASESTYLALRAARGTGEATPDGIVRALRLLGAYFERQVGAQLPALAQYLRFVRA